MDLPEIPVSEVSNGLESNISDLDQLMMQNFKAGKAFPTAPAVAEPVEEAPPVETETAGAVKAHKAFAYLRDFLYTRSFYKTLDTFEAEKLEMEQLAGDIEDGLVPDQLFGEQEIYRKLKVLETELNSMKTVCGNLKVSLDRVKRERDFHRTQHQRMAQEKQQLLKDVSKIKHHYSRYEPAISELKFKYDALLKEKFLVKLDRDKLKAKIEAFEEARIKSDSDMPGNSGDPGDASKKAVGFMPKPSKKLTPWPTDSVQVKVKTGGVSSSPVLGYDGKSLKLTKSFIPQDSHPVSCIDVCPAIGMVVTGSDDKSVKISTFPTGDHVLVCTGHTGFVTDVTFHPTGTLVSSCSSDSTVKLWDIKTEQMVANITGHTGPVWTNEFHPTHDFLLSGSQDQTVKVYDLNAMKIRHSIRGHVDAINKIAFPENFTGDNKNTGDSKNSGININYFGTASADKTVSIWDMRNTSNCLQSFYGHTNSVNTLSFGSNYLMASCDADGYLLLWDLRNCTDSILRVDTHTGSNGVASTLCFDPSGVFIAVGSTDGLVRVFDCNKRVFMNNSSATHQDGVLDISWKTSSLVTCSQDGVVKVWN
jgi:sperm-associated antigen 16 protein